MIKIFQKSRKWSTLLIGLIVTLLLSVLVIGFMEKVMKVGKNAKSIEQSTEAYYLASAQIEETLNFPDIKKTPWNVASTTNQGVSGYNGAFLQATTKGVTIPAQGKWNSPFDSDYNIISLTEPVQLMIPDWIDWANVEFDFRVPNTTKTTNNTSVNSLDGLILWTFGNENTMLYANESELFKKDLITGQMESDISIKNWYFYENGNKESNQNFKNFYASHGNEKCTNYACTLKLSMIKNPDVRIAGEDISNFPFLEYKITFPNSDWIPLQFMTLDATGYVGDYARKRTVQIPQITTNTALDFAVLQ